MTTRKEIKAIINEVSSKAMSVVLYEKNSMTSRHGARNTLDCLMEALKKLEQLNDYRVVCDESNNDDEIVRMDKVALDVYFKFSQNGKWVKFEGLAERNKLAIPKETNVEMMKRRDIKTGKLWKNS